MTTDLFHLPPQPTSELARARARYEAAKIAYDESDAIQDEYGDPIPSHISREYHRAKDALARTETREIERLKR